MTRERGSPPESKNCEILLLPTADRRFDTKVKCPTGRASFWVKFPTVRTLTRVKCPGIARGGGMGGFGIDWYINESRVTFFQSLLLWPWKTLLKVKTFRLNLTKDYKFIKYQFYYLLLLLLLFFREVWWLVRESERFVKYTGESRIIRECKGVVISVASMLRC